MVDEEAEHLDWGNDDDEQVHPSDPYRDYSPRQFTGGDDAGVPEDAEDAVSLGGDDDEREFYANHPAAQAPIIGIPPLAKSPSSLSYSHAGKRDTQRLSTTIPSRAPSRAQDSQSPSREARPSSSAGKLPPAPLMHALPPKPVLVPPLFEQPSEPGTLASAMVGRQRKSNGSSKTSTNPDDGDPLPPDWEIRYPRGGGKDAYYYNVKTEESTWVRPPPPGRSPSSKRENGSASLSGRRSPATSDSAWPDRTGRSQQSRPPAGSRRTTSPIADLTYEDRHYRPSEAPAPTFNSNERHGERNNGSAYYPESTFVPTRSVSPQPLADDRRRTRSSSPQWDRGVWHESHPQDRQAAVSDSSWGPSQDYSETSQTAPRSPSSRRVRRKDDIEPAIQRRKDDIDPQMRRKDDIEPLARRKDVTEPHTRRKGDVEPRSRRKDDNEPPLRRKDDIEPPLRTLSSRDTISRHAYDEWPAPRPRSPPPHLRGFSSPRRNGPPSLSSNPDNMTPAPNTMRESFRYERPNSPPARFSDSNPNYHGSIPQRRVRDLETSETGFDGSKRRRLNDEPNSSRYTASELPPPAASLPAKPATATYPADAGSQTDVSHRKRAPLPPQHQQWKNSNSQSISVPSVSAALIRSGSPVLPQTDTHGHGSTFTPTNEISMPPVAPRRRNASPGLNRASPIKVGGRSRLDLSGPSPSGPSRRDKDAMEVDVPPPSRSSSAARLDIMGRSGTGGMYSDRMSAAPASDGLPRAPRAMVPRDNNAHSLASFTVSPPSPQSARPPGIFDTLESSGRGRSRLAHPPGDRRWELIEPDRRANCVESPSAGPVNLLPKHLSEQDLAERQPPRVSDVVEQRGHPRGRPTADTPTSSSRRLTGTNSIPIGPRPQSYEVMAPPSNPASFKASDISHLRGAHGLEDLESYVKRRHLPSAASLPIPQRPRTDPNDRRPVVTAHESVRGRDAVNNEMSPHQSRYASREATPRSEPRIWQTRQERELQASFDFDDRHLSRELVERTSPEEISPWQLAPREPPLELNIPPHHELRPLQEPPLRESATRGPTSGRWASRDDSFGQPLPIPSPSLASLPSSGVSRNNKTIIPPPTAADRRHGESLPAIVGKVHPDRARLLVNQAPGPIDKPAKAPVRIRRPAKSPDRAYPPRARDADERFTGLPPKPELARAGPPRERSPVHESGSRPDLKRASSLLERLSVNEEHGILLQDRFDAMMTHGSEGAPSARGEMDNEVPSSHGDDTPKGGGRGMGRKRHGKSRRGRQRNGGL